MDILEKFNRRVIELIHGLPYEEAIKKEVVFGSKVRCKRDKIGDECGYLGDYIYIEREPLSETFESLKCQSRTSKKKTTVAFGRHYLEDLEFLGLPITIGRVIQALGGLSRTNINNLIECYVSKNYFYFNTKGKLVECFIQWRHSKKNRQGVIVDCTSEDQSKKTLTSLFELLEEV